MKRGKPIKRTPMKRGREVDGFGEKPAVLRRSRINPISATRRARSGVAGKLGIVRLYGADLTALRRRVYERDGGRCQYMWDGDPNKKCNKLLPFDGDLFTRAHMAHIQGKGAGGSDTEANTRLLCYFHHIIVEHGGGKVVPAK